MIRLTISKHRRKILCDQIDEAEDGSSAIDQLRSGKPYDLVLLDLDMPGINGFEFLKLVKAENGRLEDGLLRGEKNAAADERGAIMATGSSRPKCPLSLLTGMPSAGRFRGRRDQCSRAMELRNSLISAVSPCSKRRASKESIVAAARPGRPMLESSDR